MTDNRKSAFALIAGSLGMIITMAIHPHGAIASAQVETMARNLTLVHSLALASLMILFLGTVGLSRQLRNPDRLEVIALVVFAFASFAVMNAAVMDGLVAPNVMRRIVEAGAGGGQSWQAIFRYNLEINQGFTRLYVVASAMAIVFWSVSMLKNKSMSRGLGIYGCLFSAIAIIVIASGRVPMDVHGFGAIVLGQAIWFVGAAVSLSRDSTAIRPLAQPHA
jgi:hypothetical protein